MGVPMREEVIYVLEFLKPGSGEVLMSFMAGVPFMTIGKGDFIDASGWPETKTGRLRVVDISHAITQAPGQITHALRVSTEEVNQKSLYEDQDLKVL